MAHSRKRVVLASTPGLVQKATECILASFPEVDLVATPPGALSATGVLSRAQPDLLLIDATLAEDEVGALMGWVRQHYPGVRCAVITVTSRQRDLALDWGADFAFHRGDLAGHLREILAGLPASTSAAPDRPRAGG